jgi:hypothetical protein
MTGVATEKVTTKMSLSVILELGEPRPKAAVGHQVQSSSSSRRNRWRAWVF